MTFQGCEPMNDEALKRVEYTLHTPDPDPLTIYYPVACKSMTLCFDSQFLNPIFLIHPSGQHVTLVSPPVLNSVQIIH